MKSCPTLIFVAKNFEILLLSLVDYRPLYDIGDVAEHKLLFKRIEQTYPELDYSGCLKVYGNILKCVEKKHLVSLLLYSCSIF